MFGAIINLINDERRLYMLSIYQLMKYLRNTHHINVKSGQTQALRNMGYYHGFKGYRFIREDTNRVNFSSLDEIIALNKYDMRLKTVLYPKVMFIENALKSYVIEALLADSKSENFDVILDKLDIENPIIRINTAFKGCSSLEKISVLPRIYHN